MSRCAAVASRHRQKARGASRGRPSIASYRNGTRAWSTRWGGREVGGEMGRNGGRARCPHRAARVMRVGKWRREPGDPAAEHRAARVMRDDGVRRGNTNGRGMPSRAPRRWRGGAIGTSRPTAKAHEEDARCQAAHGDGAMRRDGDIAPYRKGARVVRTARGHEWGARRRDTSGAHATGGRRGGTRGAHGGRGRRTPLSRKIKFGAWRPGLDSQMERSTLGC